MTIVTTESTSGDGTEIAHYSMIVIQNVLPFGKSVSLLSLFKLLWTLSAEFRFFHSIHSVVVSPAQLLVAVKCEC